MQSWHLVLNDSANAPWSARTDKVSLASRQGGDSPTHNSANIHENGRECAGSMNVPQDMSMHLLGVTSHIADGAGAKAKDSLWKTESCPGVEVAIGGANGDAHSTFLNSPP